ncbi:MAG: manganese efflux pump MntP family protein [Ruthenibacterium sp.]
MGFTTLVFLALGLSMDAFAVSVINSMCFAGLRRRDMVLTSFTFGVFQALMPVLGYWAGSAFTGAMRAVDHWLAFALLAFIGGKMIWDSLREWNEPVHCPIEHSLSVKLVLTQGVATSIDALAVGVSLAALNANVYSTALLIGGVTFVCCLLGHFLGKKLGGLFSNWAQIAGGAVLIGIGIKILCEHLWG